MKEKRPVVRRRGLFFRKHKFSERPYYILRDDHIVFETTIDEWARWYETALNREVATDFIENYWIHTLFHGVDRGFGDGPPMIFETMVSEEREAGTGLRTEKNSWLWSTWTHARRGHEMACEWVRNGCPEEGI